MKQCMMGLLACVCWAGVWAQNEALTNTDKSKHATLHAIDMGDVHWTTGFWADRFRICKDSMIPHLWRIYHDKRLCHSYENFLIAAGIDTGSHEGPPFHDGDFFKLLEAMAAVYAVTKEHALDSMMDQAIAVIAACQRPDGYLSTPALIEERHHPGSGTAFEDRLNFETYNMGHLMTAACVHYRATGKTTLLKVAIRAADYLASFYRKSTPQLARNAICPSHYMGIVELFRTTRNPVYLQLAKDLIDIRGRTDDGTDDNQDRVPFRQQTTAMGHAVRANYLYAGVADLVAETGDDSLYRCLTSIWQDITERKMYITGGCGALYDGVSPDATSYTPAQIQEVHQAYGRDYQLPNTTAHNETCANIGNMLFNWRMLLVTGDTKYADILEQALYNSVLSGVSLDGNRYFYTNPLRIARAFPYSLRWSGGRQEYISLSNCCPPNLARTLAEVADYAYCTNDRGLWVNLYGANRLDTHLPQGGMQLEEATDYPWDGKVTLTLREAPSEAFSIFLRIPGWCDNASIIVNGRPVAMPQRPGRYAEIHRTWKKGDVLTLQLPMRTELIEANSMVEETRGQVAVRRGPIVYCLESPDLPAGESIFDVTLPARTDLHPVPVNVADCRLTALEGSAWLMPAGNGRLYRELPSTPPKKVPIRLIPYFAWANRGPSDMTVWMELTPVNSSANTR